MAYGKILNEALERYKKNKSTYERVIKSRVVEGSGLDIRHFLIHPNYSANQSFLDYSRFLY